VDIDLEMSNMAANQLLYSTLVEQANQKLSTLRYLVRGGG
jgi:flagellar basal-body rod protein FlgB